MKCENCGKEIEQVKVGRYRYMWRTVDDRRFYCAGDMNFERCEHLPKNPQKGDSMSEPSPHGSWPFGCHAGPVLRALDALQFQSSIPACAKSEEQSEVYRKPCCPNCGTDCAACTKPVPAQGDGELAVISADRDRWKVLSDLQTSALAAALERIRELESALDKHRASHLPAELIGQEVEVNHGRYHGKGILVRVDCQKEAIPYVKLGHGEDRWYEASTVKPTDAALRNYADTKEEAK